MAAFKSTATSSNPDVANVDAIGTVSSVAANTVILAFENGDEPQLVRDLLETARVLMVDDLGNTETGDRQADAVPGSEQVANLTSLSAVSSGNAYAVYDAASDSTELHAAFDNALVQIDDYFANLSS